MSAKLTESKKALIMADYHIGMSQNALAIKYDVSKGTINKMCKGVTPLNKETVNTLTRVQLELAGQNEQNVTAVNREVNERLQDMIFFRSASLRIIEKALDLAEGANLHELEKAQNIIGKGKENIYGKAPETAIQVNNQSGVVNQITRRIIDPSVSDE